MNLEKIYNLEKIINKYFKEKYNYSNEEIFNKQVLELICELSEFAYETKCFKYWKNEPTSDAKITISEFADCLMITLSFCDLAHINNLKLEDIKEGNMVDFFIEANNIASSLKINLDENKLQRILSLLIAISKLLNYKDEELEKYCVEKMQKTLKMIKK